MFSTGKKWFKTQYRELDYLPLYFRLVFLRWQTILGGAAVITVVWTFWFYTGNPPLKLTWAFVGVVIFLASYHVWRINYVRFIPRLKITGTNFIDTPVVRNNVEVDQRTFIQLLPECLTESPVYECVGYLQHIDKPTAGGGGWEETALDRNLVLNWGEGRVELHPRSEKPLNIFFIQHHANQIIPNLGPTADIPWQRFDALLMREPILRFYVQITCSDRVDGDFVSIKPVRVCLEVRFEGPNRYRPILELRERE